MTDLATLFVDAAIAATLVEAAWLLVSRRFGPPRAVLANLGAGLALMLGLRAALAGASWPWIAAALAASGLAHTVDLVERRRAGDAGRGP